MNGNLRTHRKLLFSALLFALVLLPSIARVNAWYYIYTKDIPPNHASYGVNYIYHGTDYSSYVKVEVEYSGDFDIVRARITRIKFNWVAQNTQFFPPWIHTLNYVRNRYTLRVGLNSRTYGWYSDWTGSVSNPYLVSGTRDDTPNDWVSYSGSGGITVELNSKIKVYIYLVGTRYATVTSTIVI
ncbi:MAG: hypothetical protein ACFFFG_12560 [Candidatus Thorarchaeota archaeon]